MKTIYFNKTLRMKESGQMFLIYIVVKLLHFVVLFKFLNI